MEASNRVGLELFKNLLKPDARSAHILAFGAAFGSQVWVSFVGGPVAFTTLPRQQFGNLMSKVFPVYFGYQATLSALLVGTLAWDHSVVRKHPFDIFDATVYQAFTLATGALINVVNGLIVGPASTKVMQERHRQEKVEGKAYSDEGVSTLFSLDWLQFDARTTTRLTRTATCLGIMKRIYGFTLTRALSTFATPLPLSISPSRCHRKHDGDAFCAPLSMVCPYWIHPPSTPA